MQWLMVLYWNPLFSCDRGAKQILSLAGSVPRLNNFSAFLLLPLLQKIKAHTPRTLRLFGGVGSVRSQTLRPRVCLSVFPFAKHLQSQAFSIVIAATALQGLEGLPGRRFSPGDRDGSQTWRTEPSVNSRTGPDIH